MRAEASVTLSERERQAVEWVFRGREAGEVLAEQMRGMGARIVVRCIELLELHEQAHGRT